MKLFLTVRLPSSHSVGVLALGLLVALAGCANHPVRLTTLEADASPALITPAESDIEAPVPVHTVTPRFPFEMRRAGRVGSIKLRCLIGENGAVREAEVMTSSAWELETPALHAAFQWTFKPARRDGVPMAHWVIIPMSFILTD